LVFIPSSQTTFAANHFYFFSFAIPIVIFNSHTPHFRQEHDESEWKKLLPLAEFAYNDACHSSTKVSPFFANYGYNPSWHHSENSVISRAGYIANNINEVHEYIKQQIKEAQEKYKANADNKRAEAPTFNVGDFVFLKATNIKIKERSKQFAPKAYGPFRITHKISDLAYKLDLPPKFSKKQRAFHVNFLEKVHQSQLPGRTNEPPPPVEIEGEDEYEVERIEDMRKSGRKTYYYVKWLGYDISNNTWEPEENLKHAQDLVQDFLYQRGQRQAINPRRHTQ